MTLTFRHHLRYRPRDHQLRMPQLQQIRKQGMKQILKAKWLLKKFSDEGFYIFHNNRLLNKSVMCEVSVTGFSRGDSSYKSQLYFELHYGTRSLQSRKERNIRN
ncbi:uncharacterized protein [Montipora foliosa]|uniref:uncharacterized protein isoform X3 n=1 Tax=Montipora foliosa TaxID=591990 RepID=UPI0035F15685